MRHQETGISAKPKVLRRPASLEEPLEPKQPLALVRPAAPTPTRRPRRGVAPWYEDQHFAGTLVVIVFVLNVALYYGLSGTENSDTTPPDAATSIYDGSRASLSSMER